uniref:Lipoprotein n=1 Tax=Rheinheimera sp. BAL341 TaxID=1708203 RepID=A0A486XSP0_9GAMM
MKLTSLRCLTLPVAVSAALLSGCGPQQQNSTPQPTATVVMQQSESDKANALFEQIFADNLKRDPVRQTALGIKDDYDKWRDLSDAHFEAGLALTRQHLTMLEAIDVNKLDQPTRISYLLMQSNLQQDLDEAKWRLYSYPVNQMFGTHSQVPSLLINQHRITDESDAKAYIARLNAVPTLFNQLQQQLQRRADAGIIAPKFVFPHVISASENVLKGAPFTEGEDSTLLADFSKKLAALELSENSKKLLLDEAKVALLTSIKPAYTSLISYLQQLEQQAGTIDGVWRFNDGVAFYNAALKSTTTTNLTAEQIHQLGLDEVARIHNEMRAIMQKTNFEGDLKAFFNFMQTDAQFYYPDTAEGKAAYLAQATAVIDHMRSRLDELFLVQPKADMIVKAVEPFREQSAGKAFYQSPSIDGSRPGIYYANLYRMSDMPKYELEALAYHEGIPGHHMQRAIAQELSDMPKFRRFGSYTAYNEGWGLYTELLPKEIGLYQDPYSDFGRLAMELWRACRLVVDTGIHAKQWSREEAIAYLLENTPNTETAIEKAIERYIVMPSQATAYTVGMIKIIELREKAKTALGDKFDIRVFHDVVLKNGAVPLDVLEQLVDEYIAASQV